MSRLKLFDIAEKIRIKLAQRQLSDEAIKSVVLDYYKEAGMPLPTDIRIQYQETPQETYHYELPQLSVYVWSNSYLNPPHDTTLQDRLHQAFDPERTSYSFYVKFF